MVGKEEATLSALINPQKGETGKLKAAWKWKPDTQVGAFCSFTNFIIRRIHIYREKRLCAKHNAMCYLLFSN